MSIRPLLALGSFFFFGACALAAEPSPDETVRALVAETRALLAKDNLDDAVEKVQEALAVEGASLQTRGTVFEAYADAVRKRGDAEKADKSLLKAYDFFMKAHDEAKDAKARQAILKSSRDIAVRLSSTDFGRGLLENYRAKKAAKKKEQTAAAEKEAAAKKKTTKRTETSASRKSSSRSSHASASTNTWNPWKKGVSIHKFDTGAKRDEEMPWTIDEAKKLDPKLAGLRGNELVYQTYGVLKAKYGPQRALDWYERILCRSSKFVESKDSLPGLWNFYGFYAFNALDHGRVLEAVEGLKSHCHAKPTWYFAGRGVPSIKMFEDLKTFPRDTATIRFPTENIWVKGKRTVRAKDYGWNAADATDCLRKALADPKADIVVLDKMESPWLITHIDVPSNKTLLFENGVRLHATVAEQRANSKAGLFTLKDTENVAFIGKGDVTIGVYPDFETRKRYINGEGGTGIYVLGTKNTLVRDLRIAECGCDGFTVGGCGRYNEELYLENVVLDSNSRQAMSMCNGCNVYMKNVKFLNTVGAQPMAGIDFEPSIQEVEATCNVYLIDCAFDNNTGGNIVFSESSTYPVTVLFKNCDIGSHNYGAVRINALCGLYQGNGTDAPSDIIFDGCTIKGVSWYPPVTIENANLFHITFRDCDVVETAGKPVGVSPFSFYLNREYYSARRGDRDWYAKEGSVAFDRTRIKGWKKSEPLSFVDKTGHYSVKNIYGAVTMNGKNVDMTKFRYDAPDFKFTEVADFSAASLKPTDGLPANAICGSVAFSWHAPWWVKTSYEVFTKSGGGYASAPIESANDAQLASAAGASFRSTSSDGLFRFEAPTTVYFLVPPGKGEATLKLVEAGSVDFLKGRDKVVQTYTARDFVNGFAYVKVRQSSKPQVYGLRATRGALTFKFFAPYSGLVAIRPSDLPSPTVP